MHALVTDSRGRASTHHQPLYWDAVPSVRRAARRLRPPPAAALAPAATLLASASRALARLRLRRSRCSRRRRSLSLLAPRRRPVPFIAAPPLVVPLPLVTPPLLASRFTALLLLMLQECHMRRASFTEPPAFSPRRGSIRCSGRIVDPSSSRNPQPHLVLSRQEQRVELTVQPVATAVVVRILLVRVEIRIVGDELGRDACELVDMNVTLFANHRNIAIHGVHSSCKRNSGLWHLRMMVCRNPSIVSSVTFGSAVLSMANKVISTQKSTCSGVLRHLSNCFSQAKVRTLILFQCISTLTDCISLFRWSIRSTNRSSVRSVGAIGAHRASRSRVRHRQEARRSQSRFSWVAFV